MFVNMYDGTIRSQGLVTVHLNILSMHKHVQGRTPFLPLLASSRVCFFINPAVSEANMVDTCKHFEIGSGGVSHLSVFAIEHLCRAQGATNTKQIK